MKSYRTIFTGNLVQQSALSVGGNEPSGVVDSPCCSDGLGRPTLRGTTLAGALIATARKIFEKLPDGITGRDSSIHFPLEFSSSAWRFFNAHPEQSTAPAPEFRQGVGIRQDTGAASSGVLFDVETFPRGTQWPFCLEVDTTLPNGPEIAATAAAALLEWSYGRCWIGRSVARGLGWMKLEGLEARSLTVDHLELWPDSSKDPFELIPQLPIPVIKPEAFTDYFKLTALSKQPWSYLEIDGTIDVGLSDDGYGLDAISVGGHTANQAFAQWSDNYLGPQGKNDKSKHKDFSPDNHIVLTKNLNDDLEPFVPGSGLRGTIRHALSRMLRMKGNNVGDPGVRQDHTALNEPDEVEKIFGTMEDSSSLLVRDAYLETGSKWTAAWMQHHAEDEFTGGVFGSSKFDRVALTEARLCWKMTIEAETREDCLARWKMLEPVLDLGAKGHLPLGGAQWRGLGWPRWSVNRAILIKAGDPQPCEVLRENTEVK